MILSGHAHYTGCGQFAGVPVWIGPAVAYHSDAMPPRGRLRGRAGGGFSRIDLVAGQFVATAVSVAPAREVYNHDRETRYRFLKSLTPKVG
jgi:hypothetical protein